MFQHVRLQIAISYCSIRNNLSLKSLLSVHFTDFETIESFKPDTMVLNTIVDCLDESYVDPVLDTLPVLIQKYTYICDLENEDLECDLFGLFCHC